MEYTLMHKRIPVAEITIDDISCSLVGIGEVYDLRHAPLGAIGLDGGLDRKELHRWWFHRAIPMSRAGLADALAGMQVEVPQMLVERCLALSLSDQYWVRPTGTELKWEDVNFFTNAFSEDVGKFLFGERVNGSPDLMSPDNTSDGCLKKRWRVSDGKRLLVKGGNGQIQQEPFNEVFASRLMDRLGGFMYVPYWLRWEWGMPFSVCEDFVAADTELVNASSLVKGSEYQHFLDCCELLGIPGVVEALDRMLVLDFLIANDDRHYNNFGALRNADTLEWIGMAPIFDCGSSMWCNQPTSLIDVEDVASPSRTFRKNHREQVKLVQRLDWLDPNRLGGLESLCWEVFAENPFMDEFRREKLCRALAGRVKWLKDGE